MVCPNLWRCRVFNSLWSLKCDYSSRHRTKAYVFFLLLCRRAGFCGRSCYFESVSVHSLQGKSIIYPFPRVIFSYCFSLIFWILIWLRMDLSQKNLFFPMRSASSVVETSLKKWSFFLLFSCFLRSQRKREGLALVWKDCQSGLYVQLL